MPESLEGVKATHRPPTYLPHRLLAYQALAVRARRAAASFAVLGYGTAFFKSVIHLSK